MTDPIAPVVAAVQSVVPSAVRSWVVPAIIVGGIVLTVYLLNQHRKNTNPTPTKAPSTAPGAPPQQ